MSDDDSEVALQGYRHMELGLDFLERVLNVEHEEGEVGRTREISLKGLSVVFLSSSAINEGNDFVAGVDRGFPLVEEILLVQNLSHLVETQDGVGERRSDPGEHLVFVIQDFDPRRTLSVVQFLAQNYSQKSGLSSSASPDEHNFELQFY